MQTGPQNMPSFPDKTLPEQDKRDIIAYLKAVNSKDAENPGGSSWAASAPSSRACSPGSSASER